jgi:His-Xaa-Ser system protein HxsD
MLDGDKEGATLQGCATTQPSETTLVLSADLGVYPLDAVMGSGYVFIDRCFVFLDKPDPGTVRMTLTARPGTSPEALALIAGDLQNELLSQALRHAVSAQHERVRELLIARALFGAAPELAGEDAGALDVGADQPIDGAPALPAEDDDYLDDPLGISMPWEERFAAGAATPPAEGAAPDGAAPPPAAAAPPAAAQPAEGGPAAAAAPDTAATTPPATRAPEEPR